MDIRINEQQLEMILKAAEAYLKDYRYKGYHDEEGLYHSSMNESDRIALEFFIECHKPED